MLIIHSNNQSFILVSFDSQILEERPLMGFGSSAALHFLLRRSRIQSAHELGIRNVVQMGD